MALSARALSLSFPRSPTQVGGVCVTGRARARAPKHRVSRFFLLRVEGEGGEGEKGGGGWWGSMTFELKKQDYRFSFMVWFFNAGFFLFLLLDTPLY